MTDNLEELERLLAKATPGKWGVDSEYDNDALYSGGGCESGFRNFFIGANVDGSWKTLLDTQNSDYKLIEEDYDEGSKDAWDEIGRNNAVLIVALRNAAPSLIATAREVERLRAALQKCADAMALVTEGNPMGVGKNDKCEHGRFGFEGCESCTDSALDPALDAARAALEGKGG